MAEATWFPRELNAIHPFREGNGRSQLAFLAMLGETAGFALDFARVRHAASWQPLSRVTPGAAFGRAEVPAALSTERHSKCSRPINYYGTWSLSDRSPSECAVVLRGQRSSYRTRTNCTSLLSRRVVGCSANAGVVPYGSHILDSVIIVPFGLSPLVMIGIAMYVQYGIFLLAGAYASLRDLALGAGRWSQQPPLHRPPKVAGAT
ncbi:hypothetical protein [Bradyrhizobium sp. BEA-2-5]|uniref:hypothetical protein n=1 Tax=Bradyrhizobium sp. BEA-2-5 TaxID=3080015 RepID=UPI0039798B13